MYNAKIAHAINRHLEDEEISLVAFDKSDGTFGFNLHSKGPIYSSQFIIRVREDDYSVFAFCPIRPDAGDPAVMAKMAEFVTRANYALKSGNFELDLNDGELRYKTYVDCEGQIPPSQSVIRASIGVPAAMMRRYGPGIANVIFKGMDPKIAVEECERDRDMLSRSMREEQKRHSCTDERDQEDADDCIPS